MDGMTRACPPSRDAPARLPPRSHPRFYRSGGCCEERKRRRYSLLEHCVRENLNRTAARVMGVLQPLEGGFGQLSRKGRWKNWKRSIIRKIRGWLAQGAVLARAVHRAGRFPRDPPPKYFRLAPGREVRLRYGYFITCVDVIKDDAGEVVELHCTYDPETRGGYAPDGRKVQGTLHWVSAEHALDAEIRLYDRLFNRYDPMNAEEGKTFLTALTPSR
jgi:glutaminyl-tRNA synthetase